MSLVEQAFARISAELMEQNFQMEKRINELEVEKDAWQGRFYAVEGKVEKLEQALDVALNALENSAVKHPQQIEPRNAAIKLLKEVRRD